MGAFNLGPDFIRQFKALRAKVESLGAAVHRLGRQNPGGLVVSEVRSHTQSYGPGVVGVAFDASGVGTPVGIVVTRVIPVAHWTFRWFPYNTNGIAVQNDSSTQTITFEYRVVGTG